MSIKHFDLQVQLSYTQLRAKEAAKSDEGKRDKEQADRGPASGWGAEQQRAERRTERDGRDLNGISLRDSTRNDVIQTSPTADTRWEVVVARLRQSGECFASIENYKRAKIHDFEFDVALSTVVASAVCATMARYARRQHFSLYLSLLLRFFGRFSPFLV